MGFLIDASVLIEHERGRLDLERHVRRHGREELYLSTITASELLHGVHRAREIGVRARRAAWVESVLTRFPILPVDLGTARAHARIQADLAAEGRLIGPHDLWLAATALTRGLTLVTGNLRELERVPGLEVESWAVAG